MSPDTKTSSLAGLGDTVKEEDSVSGSETKVQSPSSSPVMTQNYAFTKLLRSFTTSGLYFRLLVASLTLEAVRTFCVHP